MQLFYKGDILQMRDKSQWEIINAIFDDGIYIYDFEEIQSGEKRTENEVILNRNAIVIQFANPMSERPKCKIYYLADYVKKVEKISNNG